MKTEIALETKIVQDVLKKPTQFPWIIPVFCDGCGSCVNRCKVGVLKMTETNHPGVFVPWLKDYNSCVGCGRCATNCAMGGISMTKFVDKAIQRFAEKSPVLPD